MRHRDWIMLALLAAVLCVAASLGVRPRATAAPPPLSLDGIRDEKLVEGPHDSAALEEINGGCYVCHDNYRTESLVASHAKEKVGCVECHGKSLPHQVDEFHRTPPEKMYGRHNVDKMCVECHEQHDAPARKVIERWRERCAAKGNPKEAVCTDCHYEHRLRSRTVVWDKKTGKLVVHAKGEVVAANVQAAESGKRKPGPRKVVVGTLMYNMFHEYPGLDRRLEELGRFIDKMAEEAKRQYPGRQLDIAALPEMAVNGNARGSAAEVSVRLEGPVLETMGAKAREHRCYVAVPLYLADDRKEDLYYNAVVLLDRQGEVAGIYRKVFPVAGRNQRVLEGGVTPGNEFPVFDCDFGRVGFQICFDISFDDGWEALGRKGAELVIWPTQSPGQIKPAFRAMRNNYYVLTSTWRNNASLLDPTGHRIQEITGADGVFVEEIDLDYVLLTWQPTLRDGKIFTEKYGDRVGYRYSRAEDSGIFWSNDPGKPILDMVRELDLELPADLYERNRLLHAKFREGPVEP